MIYITIPDMNDSMSAISINQTEYLLRFTYNECGNYWSFGIYDVDEFPIVAMTKIVPNFPFLHYLDIDGLPDGVFGALSNEGRIHRNSFNEGKAEFIFIPTEELE